MFSGLILLAGLSSGAAFSAAQAPNPSSATNPFWGSVTAHPATDKTLKLSLDEAVKQGLENNLGLKQTEAMKKALEGQKLEAVQQFFPLIQLSGGTGVHQHNLAALGFGPGVIAKLGSFFPGGVVPAGVSAITRDDLTQGQLQFSQTLFSGPVFAGYKAAGAADRASQLSQWPVQLHLIAPQNPVFHQADLLLAADCTAFAMADFNQAWLPGKKLAIACPKLDGNQEVYLAKLTALIDEAQLNSITVMIMEVPCCGGLLRTAQAAAARAARKVPIRLVVVGVDGAVRREGWVA